MTVTTEQTTCPPEHKHGASTTCYVHHLCRCTECRAARSSAEKQRKRLKAYGRFDTGLVDAAPVRDHLRALSRFGIGYKRAAELAGIGTTATRTLLQGRSGARRGEMQKRVSRKVAEAILAVQPIEANLRAGARVPTLPLRRRVQALAARGWSVSSIAGMLGFAPSNFHVIVISDQVSAATHRAMTDLYERLWNVAPPQETHRQRISVSRTMRTARERGWVPPLGWDDIDNDPAPAAPEEAVDVDEIAVELAVGGEVRPTLTAAEVRAAVLELHARRLSDRAIADRVGRNVRTVERIREELGLPGLACGEQSAQARRAA